jgi:uncharacterized membrane protein
MAGGQSGSSGKKCMTPTLTASGTTLHASCVGRIFSFPALVPVVAGPFFFCAAPTEAALSVCNKTMYSTAVALGFIDGRGWNSAGWWIVGPGNCAQVVSEPLNARYYYLYAVREDGGSAWAGDRTFCIKQGSDKFSIQGRSNCAAQGYEARRFFQVDTGNSPNWTQNLAD